MSASSSPALVCSDSALISAITFSLNPTSDVRSMLLSAPSHPYSDWYSWTNDDDDGVFIYACGMRNKAQRVDVVRELHDHIERQGGAPAIATDAREAKDHIEYFQFRGSRGQFEYALMFVAKHGGREIIKQQFGLKWEEGERPIIRQTYADKEYD